MTALPTLDQVRAWCGVSVTLLPDVQLQVIYDAEAYNQGKVCRLPDPLVPTERTADQIAAFYRRCARAIAAKGIPLGQTESEYGPARIPSYDAEIERYEGSTRRFVAG